MTNVRRANLSDVPELIRLRGIMLAAMDGYEATPGPWQAFADQTLRQELATAPERLAGFVVDKPDRPGELAACVIGTIERRLGSPADPRGEFGYVFNVATDPDYRKRGYSRACMEALLAWFQAHGVTRIDLHASTYGEPLYRKLGFVEASPLAMAVKLPTP